MIMNLEEWKEQTLEECLARTRERTHYFPSIEEDERWLLDAYDTTKARLEDVTIRNKEACINSWRWYKSCKEAREECKIWKKTAIVMLMALNGATKDVE